MFAGNFAPAGWLFCHGQILSIASYDTLFNLIGTTYGGDGVTTFALPDLRGRVPVSTGQRAGTSAYVLGEQAGVEQVTLTANQMPSHNHSVACNSTGNDQAGTAASPTPVNNFFGTESSGAGAYENSSNSTMNPGMITFVGGSSGATQPHENRQPYLAINYIIAWAGIYPSQN
jgi:microcystin-dependent protein